MMPTLISCFSKDAYYRTAAAALVRSCQKLGIPHDVRPFSDECSWIGYCRRKPRFILSMLEELRKPVFWLDADSRLARRPNILATLDGTGVDFAGVRRYRVGEKPEPLTWYVWGLWFNCTENARKLLECWSELCYSESGSRGDDRLFEVAWQRHKEGVSWTALPKTLGTISRSGGSLHPDACIDVRVSGNAAPHLRRFRSRGNRG